MHNVLPMSVTISRSSDRNVNKQHFLINSATHLYTVLVISSSKCWYEVDMLSATTMVQAYLYCVHITDAVPSQTEVINY